MEIGGDQVQAMQESIDWDAKMLVEGELEAGKPKTTVKDGKMLVTGKICCLPCPTVLMNLQSIWLWRNLRQAMASCTRPPRRESKLIGTRLSAI